MAELQVATVRAQVALSLFTEFEKFSSFRPSGHQRQDLDATLDQIISWSDTLRTIREPSPNPSGFERKSKNMVNEAEPTRAADHTSKIWNGVLWGFQVLGALSFVFAGYQKLSSAPDMVALFTAIGAGQWFRFLTGTVEILGGIALLVPRLRVLGAAGLVCVMVGALITDFMISISPVSALVELAITAVVVWGRRSELTAEWIFFGRRN